MRRWISPVVSAGLIMAGYFKSVPTLDSLVPFDLTLAFAVLVVVVVVAEVVTGTIPPRVHTVLLGFVLLVPAAFLAPSTDYATDKTTRLLTLTLLAILAPLLLIRSTADAQRFLWAWTAMCAIVVGSALLDPQQSGQYTGAPVSTLGNDTIALGDAAGLVVIVMVMGLLWRRVPWWLAVPVGGAAVYALLDSGSRGPLFSVVGCLLVGVLLVRGRPRLRRSAVVLGLVAVGLVAAFGAAPLYSRQRIDELLAGDVVGSTNTRIGLYEVAGHSIVTHPFGIGWGGYEHIAFGGYQYPHNIFLEVLAEAGVILGGLFLVWMAAMLWRAHQGTGSFAGATAFVLVVFMLATAAVSGDLNDNRTFFYALGIALAIAGIAAAQRPWAASDTSAAVTQRSPASSTAQ